MEVKDATMEQVKETIQLAEKQIESHKRAIALYEAIVDCLTISVRAGVLPKEIERSGFDPSTDPRLRVSPWRYLSKLPTIVNYVILKDGTRIELPVDLDAERERWKNRHKSNS